MKAIFILQVILIGITGTFLFFSLMNKQKKIEDWQVIFYLAVILLYIILK